MESRMKKCDSDQNSFQISTDGTHWLRDKWASWKGLLCTDHWLRNDFISSEPWSIWIVYIKFSCTSCVETTLKQGSYMRTRIRPCVWWESGTQQLPWLTCHMGSQFLTNFRKCPDVGKDTEEAVCSLPHTVYASASVSYPLVSGHKTSTGKVSSIFLKPWDDTGDGIGTMCLLNSFIKI